MNTIVVADSFTKSLQGKDRIDLFPEDTVSDLINDRPDSIPGALNLQLDMLGNLPSLKGGMDFLSALSLYPGVQGFVGGIDDYIVVRGSEYNQNQVLIDGVPFDIYKFYSGIYPLVNSNAIKRASLYKGYLPAKFGGRPASVLQLELKEGSGEHVGGRFEVNFLSAGLFLEGTLSNRKTSWWLSANKNYGELLQLASSAIHDNGIYPGYTNYNISAKVSHTINHRNKISFSIGSVNEYYRLKINQEYEYGDSMLYAVTTKNMINYGNRNASFSWNFNTGSGFKSDLLFSVSGRKHIDSYASEYFITTWDSLSFNKMKDGYSIEKVDYLFRWDNEILLTSWIKLEAGIYANLSDFIKTIYNISTSEESAYDRDSVWRSSKFVVESAAYLDSRSRLSRNLELRAGIRFSSFYADKWYYGPEPRLLLNWKSKSERFSAALSWSKVNQYLHMQGVGLSSFSYLEKYYVFPITSNKLSIDLDQKIGEKFSFAAALFYNMFYKLPGITDEMAYYLYEWDIAYNGFDMTKGYTRGFELTLRKHAGRFSGWLSYTYTDSQRESLAESSLNYPYAFEGKHYFTSLLLFQPNRKFDFSVDFTYGSGENITIESVTYNTLSRIRVNAGVNLHKQKKHGLQTWSFGIYDLATSGGVYFVFSETADYHPELSLIPYVSYSLDFGK